MNNLLKLKRLLNTPDDINNILNIIIRLSIGGIIIILIIIVWSYYIFKVSIPFVSRDTTGDSDQTIKVGGDTVDSTSMNPYDLFCAFRLHLEIHQPNK